MADEKKTLLDQWKEVIDKFNDNIEKSLDEVRQYKQAIEQAKVDILNEINNGQFISDDQCIVISAPKIIIGNVSKDGNLREGGGEVIIKGHALQLNGVGEGGSITARAPSVVQEAVDPGIDGKEAVVHDDSCITSQARTIILETQNPPKHDPRKATFLPIEGYAAGITLSSEKDVSILAAPENEKKKERVSTQMASINDLITIKNREISKHKDDLKSIMKSMKDTLDENLELTKDDDLTKSNILAIDELRSLLRKQLPKFNSKILDYASAMSDLAELKRQQKNMEKADSNLSSSATQYTTKSTGAKVTVQSEKIELLSKDGDGTWRTNEGAGVDIRANDIKLRAMDEDKSSHVEKLTKEKDKGRVTIQSRNVTISTADIQGATLKDGKLEKAKFPVLGDVTIRSKTINMEAVDMEQTDASGKMKETKLTEGSLINLRAKKVRVKTINEKGESVGKFSVNSQKISLKATNIDGYKPEVELDDQGNPKYPEKMPSKELTAGSEMLLLAENMHIGYKKDKMRSKNVYMASEEKVVVGGKKETIIASDGSQLGLAGKNITVAAGDKLVLSSKSGNTVKGKTEFKEKVTTGDIDVNNIKAKGEMSSTNISDGIKTPSPTAPAEQVQNPQIPESNN